MDATSIVDRLNNVGPGGKIMSATIGHTVPVESVVTHTGYNPLFDPQNGVINTVEVTNDDTLENYNNDDASGSDNNISLNFNIDPEPPDIHDIANQHTLDVNTISNESQNDIEILPNNNPSQPISNAINPFTLASTSSLNAS